VKGFFFALLASLVLLVCAPGLCPAQEYDFSRAPMRVHNITVTGAIYVIAGGDTVSVYTADSIVTLLLATGRLTGGDVVVSDSAKCATLDASGKITGGANLAITGTGAFSGILSPLSVTLPGGGTIADPASPGTTVTITETNIALAGAVTATTMAVGSGGSVIVKAIVVGDSLCFLVGNDTFPAVK